MAKKKSKEFDRVKKQSAKEVAKILKRINKAVPQLQAFHDLLLSPSSTYGQLEKLYWKTNTKVIDAFEFEDLYILDMLSDAVYIDGQESTDNNNDNDPDTF